MSSQTGSRTVDRRRFLQGLAASSGVAVAGCIGDDDDDEEQELGERVPTVVLEYAPDAGGVSELMESSLPTLSSNIEELGIDLETSPVSISENIGNLINDTRTMDIWFIFNTGSIDNLDPQEYLFRYHITHAGSGGINQSNWANCEYSQLVSDQQFAPSLDERQSIVDDAMSVMSEHRLLVPLFPIEVEGAANTDRVNVGDIGNWGLTWDFPLSLIKAEPVEGDQLRISAPIPMVERKNWTQIDFTIVFLMWNQLVHSSLIEYDEQFDLRPALASGWEVDDSNIIFDLRDDATFHNGDPVTAEDVKFSHEFYRENHEQIYKAVDTPLTEVEIVDETTVEFHYEEPFAPALGRDLSTFGILHQETWEEAEGNIPEFEPDEVIGSGPFQLEEFDSGESLILSPHDGHPTHSPGHEIVATAFRDERTAFEAFQAGEIEIIEEISPSIRRDIQEMDEAELFPFPGTLPMHISPQTPTAPCKFLPFREALGMCIDRREINQIVYDGEADEPTNAIIFQEAHPWHPDDADLEPYTDDPTGDIEGARDVLEEAGWGWDDDGNLHYPPDADLSELWPAEGSPNPDDFECLDADGNFVRD